VSVHLREPAAHVIDIAELLQRTGFRALRRIASGDEFAFRCLEVKRDLLVDVSRGVHANHGEIASPCGRLLFVARIVGIVLMHVSHVYAAPPLRGFFCSGEQLLHDRRHEAPRFLLGD
jgi:hypothetical protein